MPDSCSICTRVSQSERGENPFLIESFRHSIFVVGDHQYHQGYCLLLLKRHVRELHEMQQEELRALFEELMMATRALVKTFNPWKMNHACLGNTDEHVHWHLFPRYETDPDHRSQPWKRSDQWKDHSVLPDRAREIAARIRANLSRRG